LKIPWRQLKLEEWRWLATHNCKAHGHAFIEHYGCYETERPESPITTLDESDMAEELASLGYKVEKLSADKADRHAPIDLSMFDGEHIRFAVISCTQLGSKYQQITYLRDFYKLADDRGIKVVLHCGDLVDGMNVYDGQEYELFIHGVKAQADYAAENYPQLSNGGITYVISGNHDYSFMKESGADILEQVSQRRSDIKYIGAYGAYPDIGPMKVYLHHGGGGGAYARSYRLQKNIEQFAPEAKPDLYFMGHYHIGCHLPMYRNVCAFMIPCFQSQTPFLRRLGLYPEIGGLIMDITINDWHRKAGLVDMKFEWVPFYVPKENDY
jgi:predicted phosphodiesterase